MLALDLAHSSERGGSGGGHRRNSFAGVAAIPPTPLYLAAQSVSLFGVMEHIEPLLSAAMTMGIFCLMASLTCAAQALADQLRPWKWSGALACLAAAAVMGPWGGCP